MVALMMMLDRIVCVAFLMIVGAIVYAADSTRSLSFVLLTFGPVCCCILLIGKLK